MVTNSVGGGGGNVSVGCVDSLTTTNTSNRDWQLKKKNYNKKTNKQTSISSRDRDTAIVVRQPAGR